MVCRLRRSCIVLFLLLWNLSLVFSQEKDSTTYDFPIVFDLDEFEVTASRIGFDTDDFIELVLTDESFYQAFRNIRFLSYQSSNSITFYDKKGIPKASMNNIIHQTSDGRCREMDILKESDSGNYYKRKKYRYYTAKMLDRLFFTHGKICEEAHSSGKAPSNPSKIEQYSAELKRLIFDPGEEVNVPLIGHKMAIFDPEMSPFYDFTISNKRYKNQTDCYVFSAVVKPKFVQKTSKTVIKSLNTYFDKETFQVIARDYHLKSNTALFDFDVNMNIELTKLGDDYVPVLIEYEGDWDVPLHKRERGEFEIRFWAYE